VNRSTYFFFSLPSGCLCVLHLGRESLCWREVCVCVCVSDRPLLLNLTCHLVLHFLHFPLCSIFSFFLFLPHSYMFISPLLSISLFLSLKHTAMHTHTH